MHDDALDRAIDAAAAEITAAPPSRSVRAAVRRRIEAPAGAPLLQWAVAAAAVMVLAFGTLMWPRTAPDGSVASGVSSAAPAASTAASSGADVLLPQTPIAAGGADAGQPRVTAVARRRYARATSPVTTAAAAEAEATADEPNEDEAVPALFVDRLNVTALQPATVALDAVPLPMPLRVDLMDVEPLALP